MSAASFAIIPDWQKVATAFVSRDEESLEEQNIRADRAFHRGCKEDSRCEFWNCFACSKEPNVAFAIDTVNAAKTALYTLRLSPDPAAEVIEDVNTILSFDFKAFLESATNDSAGKKRKMEKFVRYDKTPVTKLSKAVARLQKFIRGQSDWH